MACRRDRDIISLNEFGDKLEVLTINRSRIIELTEYARNNTHLKEHIVRFILVEIMTHDDRQPYIYLIDSIIKNVGGDYTYMFIKELAENG